MVDGRMRGAAALPTTVRAMVAWCWKNAATVLSSAAFPAKQQPAPPAPLPTLVAPAYKTVPAAASAGTVPLAAIVKSTFKGAGRTLVTLGELETADRQGWIALECSGCKQVVSAPAGRCTRCPSSASSRPAWRALTVTVRPLLENGPTAKFRLAAQLVHSILGVAPEGSTDAAAIAAERWGKVARHSTTAIVEAKVITDSNGFVVHRTLWLTDLTPM